MPSTGYFMGMAKAARLASKDRSRRVGAVIVNPDGAIISSGWNGFARGVNDDLDERHERPTKYAYTVHSEHNAILNAARIGVSCLGATIYTWAEQDEARGSLGVCLDCAKAIVQAGIKKVYVQAPIGNVAQQWDESVEIAKIILAEGGVTVEYVADGPE